MRVVFAIAVGLALFAAPVMAQPMPASLRSAGVTEEQWRQAQSVIRTQAATIGYREEVISTLAVEIFEAQPSQSVDSYIHLIRSGAERLPQALAAARALNPRGDSVLADLQTRAVAAAEQGRLREALALQDEYAARFRSALDRALAQPRLDLAASYAAAGDTAFVLANFRGAAARYSEAAGAAPETALEVRWDYRCKQANALYERGDRFADSGALVEAIELYASVALPLAPREMRPRDWASTQVKLGWAHFVADERGAANALEEAAASFSAARDAYDSAGDRLGAANAQRSLGAVHWRRSQRGTPGELELAIAAFEAALAVQTPENDPVGWAWTQNNLALAFHLDAERGNHDALASAVAANMTALTAFSREREPLGWALTQYNLGLIHADLGRLGADDGFRSAQEAYEAALTVWTRESDPTWWSQTMLALSETLREMGRVTEANAAEADAMSVAPNRAR